LHRGDDRIDAGRDVANQVEAHADTDDDGGTEDDREHHEGRCVIVGGVLRCSVGALVVEVDVLLQDLVGLDPDLVHLLGVELMGCVGDLAALLAGQRHHFLGALLVFGPLLHPLVIQRALFRGGDHDLVACTDLGVALDDGTKGLFRGQLFLKRLGEHVLADHVAVGNDAGAQIAQYFDARHPAGDDVDRIGVDRPQIPDREQSHAGYRDQQEGNDGNDLGPDRILGEHGGGIS